MPWLVGTALIHSLAVTEKRGSFRSWTVLLAIVAFSLSLVGTFLVRSGVLTSVHAFATDPARGIFILAFLAIVIGATCLILGLQGWEIERIWFYLLGSALVFLVGIQLVIYWLLLRVLEELRKREILTRQDMGLE